MKNKLKIVLITLFFIISMNNISFASQNDENKNDLSTEEYEVSNETSQNYINKQLEKINIGQLEQELKNNELFKDLNLKQYIKDLIKGEAKTYRFNKYTKFKKSNFTTIKCKSKSNYYDNSFSFIIIYSKKFREFIFIW